MSVVTVVEFLEGYESTRDGERFLDPFEWVDVIPRVARTASRVRRRLRRSGNMIGDFDVLIAATALALQVPLVTADAGHFAAVSDLVVVPYRPAT